MGYMGFGMKKENYERKPRRAFDKYRELTEHQTMRSGAAISRPHYHVSRSDWVEPNEKKSIKILKVSVGLSIFLLLLYVMLIDPAIQRGRREEFEQRYFAGLYQTCKGDLQKFLWLHESIPLMYKMHFHTGGELSVVIKSQDFNYKGDYEGGDHIVNLGGSWNKNYQEFSIANNVLYVDRVDKRYYVRNNWALIYNGNVNSDPTIEMVFPLLKLTREDFEEFECDLEDVSFESFTINEKRQLLINLQLYQYGNYEIMALENSRNPGKGWSKLDDNVYWRRKA